MKNPIPVPAVIAIVVVAVVALGGIGYHFMQDSGPILLQKDPKARGNKLSFVKPGMAANKTDAPNAATSP